MGIWVLTIPGSRDGCDVRFDRSMDVKGDRGDVVPCSSAQTLHGRVRPTVVYDISQTMKSSSTRCFATATLSDRLTKAETASCAMNYHEFP
jgi:hypothetical protein